MLSMTPETAPQMHDGTFRVFEIRTRGATYVALSLEHAHAIRDSLPPVAAVDARIRSMTGHTLDGLDAKPHEVKVTVRGDIAAALQTRCDRVGINLSELVTAMMLNHTINMTHEKTGEGLIGSLRRWLTSRRRFRPWIAPAPLELRKAS